MPLPSGIGGLENAPYAPIDSARRASFEMKLRGDEAETQACQKAQKKHGNGEIPLSRCSEMGNEQYPLVLGGRIGGGTGYRTSSGSLLQLSRAGVEERVVGWPRFAT